MVTVNIFRKGQDSMSITTLQQGKQRLRILILGAYKPVEKLKKLENLRDCLIKRGFQVTRLAMDFPDKRKYDKDMDVHYTKKSRRLIRKWAHVPILVFFNEANNLGVANELAYVCQSLLDKQSCCVVFFESGIDVGSQVRGSIKIAKKISYEIFKSDRELCDLAFGHALKVLDRLFYYLG